MGKTAISVSLGLNKSRNIRAIGYLRLRKGEKERTYSKQSQGIIALIPPQSSKDVLSSIFYSSVLFMS